MSTSTSISQPTCTTPTMQTFTKRPAQKEHVRPSQHVHMSLSMTHSRVKNNFLWAMRFYVNYFTMLAESWSESEKGRMEIIPLWAWTSDPLAARCLVIIKCLPLVCDKQEGGSKSTVSSLRCDGYNKSLVLWQSPVCVVLHYTLPLLSTNQNEDISAQTVIIVYFNPSVTIWRFLCQRRRRDDGRD